MHSAHTDRRRTLHTESVFFFTLSSSFEKNCGRWFKVGACRPPRAEMSSCARMTSLTASAAVSVCFLLSARRARCRKTLAAGYVTPAVGRVCLTTARNSPKHILFSRYRVSLIYSRRWNQNTPAETWFNAYILMGWLFLSKPQQMMRDGRNLLQFWDWRLNFVPLNCRFFSGQVKARIMASIEIL